MNYKGVNLCCPVCKGDLEPGDGSSSLRCLDCDKSYPIILDIPDLRIFPDPYIDIEADREKGRRLAEHFDDYDFEGFVGYYYQNTQVVPPQHAKMYTRGLLAGAARSKSAFEAWKQYSPVKVDAAGALLEIGCGTAPLLVAAANRFDHLVGVDIAFRWLIVGKKRLVEAGLEIPLICACAEALPFPEKTFDCIAAESTIEHLNDQMRAVLECNRVMRDGGVFYISTPNKYSLGPDPQTGIPGGGYLPDKITAKIVTRQGGIPPKRKLLAKRSLFRFMEAGKFSPVEIFLPDIHSEQQKYLPGALKAAVRVYHALKRMPGGKSLLEIFGPLLYVVGQK